MISVYKISTSRYDGGHNTAWEFLVVAASFADAESVYIEKSNGTCHNIRDFPILKIESLGGVFAMGPDIADPKKT